MSADLYITIQGDAWDSIAFRLWGDERHFTALAKANPDHLGTVIFPAQSTDTVFLAEDFRAVFAALRPGDVVYCDPPYVPLSSSASFT